MREAGLTHVHLLPAYDFATVPERPEDQLDVEVSAGVAYQPLSLSLQTRCACAVQHSCVRVVHGVMQKQQSSA